MFKKIFNCGYRCLIVADRFNMLFINKKFKKIEYNNGVSLKNIKEILEEKKEVNVYRIDDVSYLKSNMIVHTFYKGIGHYIYLIGVFKNVMFVFDPRRLFSYKIVRKNKIDKLIDINKEIHVLDIENKINYWKLINKNILGVLIILISFYLNYFILVLIVIIIFLIKKLKKVKIK